ncbi:MAG: 50S ribosomal protein L29 [Bacteroidetes bacterium]|jgi:large subunit ribosomal protein L29|nr:50S ribosomal protein L29 [Bacteroidota bacterium]
MKNIDIRALSDTELNDKVSIEKTQLLKLKMNHAVVNLDNPKSIEVQRKLVARLQTEQRQRQLK